MGKYINLGNNSFASALNNFWEYSMVEPRNMDRYFGFTKAEVHKLAKEMAMDFDELEKWYDGYHIGDEPSMFNPNSVIQAVYSHRCRSYWASTGAFDAVASYINMNYDGLRDDIVKMLAAGRCVVDTTRMLSEGNHVPINAQTHLHIQSQSGRRYYGVVRHR